MTSKELSPISLEELIVKIDSTALKEGYKLFVMNDTPKVLDNKIKKYLLVDNDIITAKDLLISTAEFLGYSIETKANSTARINKYFKDLGYPFINLDEYPDFNAGKLMPQIKKYQDALDNSDWLEQKEIYKFNFIKWIENNIDFTSNSTEEICTKISKSQELVYTPGSSVKGVNFIQTIVRYQSEYLTAEDAVKLKKIVRQEIPVNSENLVLSFNSYPKTSAFLCLFDPERFMAYDGESIPAYEYLKDKVSKEIPKKGFKAFQFYQIFYHNVKRQLKSSHLRLDKFKSLLDLDELTELHWNFITQDFLLFISRKIMINTLQKKYDEYINSQAIETWEWYLNIKKYSEIFEVIKRNCQSNKYLIYSDLNIDFKKLTLNENEDFLDRYFFSSNNGLSTIRQQLIKRKKRIEILQKVNDDFQVLEDLIIEKDKRKAFELAHQLISSNKWAVITRFLRAKFPNDFTAVDAEVHFKALLKKLKNEFDINLRSSTLIDQNKELLGLIEFDDIYKAQIFFWMYREGFDQGSEMSNDNDDLIENSMKTPVNQILFGPPGTGKTYATKRIAVEIIDNKKYPDSTPEERQAILERYKSLSKSDQIQFTTFHQSLSYEDFIEGIKPVLSDETGEVESELSYEIKGGIFKNICQLADGPRGGVQIIDNIDFSTKDFYKMSLGGKSNLDKHEWSIENNLVFLGWGDDKDFTELNKIDDWKSFSERFKNDFPELVAESKYVIQAVYIFQKMKIGDVVVVSKGNNIVDAIGIIESDYFYDQNQEIDHYQFRKVKWLATEMNVPPAMFLEKKISQQTIYKYNRKDIKIDVFNETFKPKQAEIDEIGKKYVLIIDELNRGNVSSIFGELITLIEEDKRKGQGEFIEVVLPYSKERFSVPNNVYIIGTMNTADRSVEALDTALRRRFSFTEVKPDPSKLESLLYTDVHLPKLLTVLNQRIELLIDKDHQIGHSYFINIQSLSDLQTVFQDKIVPLLEEYFYGDYGKIGLVLGEAFVEVEKDKNQKCLAKFKAYDDLDFISEKKIYRLKNMTNASSSDFKTIYESVES